MNKIKLNLGSGEDYKKEWINVDADKSTKADVYADLSMRFPFKDNYADEILASDILEHFTKEDGERFLEECWRILKLNGTITIRTHNIYKIIEKFSHDPYVLIHFLYGDTSETGIFGSHKYAYTRGELRKILKKNGYSVLSINEETTNWLVTARKSKKIFYRKLNIALIQQSPDIGGAEMFMISLLNTLREKNHKIHTASNEGKYLNLLKKNNFKTKKVPVILDISGNLRGLVKSIILTPLALLFYLNLLFSYKRKKIDFILMSNFSEKLLVSFLSLFFKIPVVWIEYGPLESIFNKNYFIPKIIYRLLKRIPKKIIVPSKNTQQSLIVDAKVSLSKIEIIPCGVNINYKNKSAYANKNQITIGNISRATREKGQEYLIAAIPLVLKKTPNTKFLFVGDGPDLELFKKKVIELKVQKNVKFAGFVKNIENSYSEMDIFVFPSIWELEGFGLVAVEAMARKIPVIGNEHGPLKEILGNNAGVLVDVKDSNKLADTIFELANNKKLRSRIADAGFKKVKKEYDIKKIADIYEDIFYNVVYFDK